MIVEKAKDGCFSAFSENVVGLHGAGHTVEETKVSLMEAIEITKNFKDAPRVLKGDFIIEWVFDTQSFLRYWKTYLTFAGMEKVTGIGAKQLQHYSTGLKTPRKPQRDKIVKGFSELGKQLRSIELVDN